MKAANIDDMVERILQALPSGVQELKQDLDQQLQAALKHVLNNMQLVTREEFDIQTAVLARTRSKLEALEKQVAILESRVARDE